jgi:hypothetical protein
MPSDIILSIRLVCPPSERQALLTSPGHCLDCNMVYPEIYLLHVLKCEIRNSEYPVRL